MDADLAAAIEGVIATEGIRALTVVVERWIATVAIAGAHRPVFLLEPDLLRVHHRLYDRCPGVVLAFAVRGSECDGSIRNLRLLPEFAIHDAHAFLLSRGKRKSEQQENDKQASHQGGV